MAPQQMATQPTTTSARYMYILRLELHTRVRSNVEVGPTCQQRHDG
jgi:hypothetical protein